MNKIILNVSYSGSKKFWQDSSIKNKIYTIDKSKNIHDEIARILEEEDLVKVSYNNKPKGNIYIDDKDGNAVIVGYHYRVMSEIYSDDDNKYHKVLFTAWVEIRGVSSFEFEEIEQSFGVANNLAIL